VSAASGLPQRDQVVGAGVRLIARDLRGEELPADKRQVKVAGSRQEAVHAAVAVMKAQGIYALGPA
jgi:hypothetical protein